MSFCSTFTNSSIASSFPSRISSATQLRTWQASSSRLKLFSAAVTAETLGSRVDRIYDGGVAGIHRLLANMEPLSRARAVVAVAGMEGALPSVVGGLVNVPVIAVPTSVGYGASFEGVAALLAMMNSCSSDVSVVNIDNGFGAGYIASMIDRRTAPL